MTWHRVATGKGQTALHRGIRWTIRGPLMGRPLYWLYRDGSRVTYLDERVSYRSMAAAKADAVRRTLTSNPG